MKRMRGVPVLWEEVKTIRTVNLTDVAWESLKKKADEMGISRSELVENLGRMISEQPEAILKCNDTNYIRITQ